MEEANGREDDAVFSTTAQVMALDLEKEVVFTLGFPASVSPLAPTVATDNKGLHCHWFLWPLQTGQGRGILTKSQEVRAAVMESNKKK